MELWQSNSELLFQTVSDSNKLLQLLSEKMSVLEKDNLELKEEVERLKEKCKVLDEIKKYRLTLMIGQLAVEIE